MSRRSTVLCAAFMASSLFAAAFAPAQTTLPNLTFAIVGGRPLQLDLYLPNAAARTPYPTVIFIHGGGWSAGSRAPLPGFCQPLIDNGIAVASVSYRLTSEATLWGGASVTFPAQINDVKGAVRWLKARASTYQLDPERFGCWGTSAGAHLAALLGTSGGVAAIEGTVGGNLAFNSRVIATVDFFGPIDLLNMMPDVTTPPGTNLDHDAFNSPESLLIGFSQPGQGIGVLRANQSNPAAPYPAFMQIVTQANPITWLDANDGAFFVAHGTADMTVPFHQSERFNTALNGVGVPHTFRPVVGAGHGALGAAANQAAAQFLIRTLKCAVDLDNGSGNGTPDGGVGIEDLLYYLARFDEGASEADVDDGTGTGTLDGGVGIEDLIYFLFRFDAGC